jgi:hypothetical protein
VVAENAVVNRLINHYTVAISLLPRISHDADELTKKKSEECTYLRTHMFSMSEECQKSFPLHARTYAKFMGKSFTIHNDDAMSLPSSSPLRSPLASPRGWITFRNVLVALITMQISILLAIGLFAPDDETTLKEFLKPAEDALEGVFAPLKDTNTGPKTAHTSLDDTLRVWKKLSDEWEKVGKYDTSGAFTNNFLVERKHPAFRQPIPSVKELDKSVANSLEKVSKMVPGESLTPCQYHEMQGDVVRILSRKECRYPTERSIVAYNSMPFERKWCGKTIPPYSIQRYSDLCEEFPSLFNVRIPQPMARGLPPIKLLRTGSNAKPELINCDMPCLATVDTCNEGKGEVCLPASSQWTVEDTDMTFTYSMLTTGQNGNLMVDPKASRQNGKHLATRSFQSEVPLSYFTWEKYGTPTPPVDFDNTTHSTTFFKSKQCKGTIRGDVWANFTAQTTRLVSYGSCFHNTDLPQGMSLDNEQDRRTLLQQNLFHLIIDTTTDEDFVDEAVWEALRAGVIPVYFGASNIKDHVPPNSIIAAADYGTKVATAERINAVANDKKLWEQYHEWRKYPFPQALKDKYNFLHTSSLCRMCKWSHAKKYGLGWNHEKQEVESKAIGGKTCITKRGVLKFPFGETWMTPTVARPARGTCNWQWPHNKTIIATDLNVNRTVGQHDGVVDVVVNDLIHTEGVVIFKMQFSVENSGGAYFSNVHQQVSSLDAGTKALMTSVAIQDSRARVTVLCDWPTKAYSPSPGIIQIEVMSNGQKELGRDEIRRIRVIPEDLDPLRDVSTEYALSPFSKRFIQDFASPLELFHLEA